MKNSIKLAAVSALALMIAAPSFAQSVVLGIDDARGGTAFSRLHFFGHSRLVSEFLSWLPPSDRIWLRETAMFGRSSLRPE